MRIAVYQGSAVRTDAAAAIAVMRRVVDEAAAGSAGLVVFPELFLCGYGVGETVCDAAEPAEGPAAEAVAEIAARSGVAVLYGYPERQGGRIYNSAQLIDGAGRSVANYRKTHLYGPWERRVFTPGEALVTASLAELKIGILICYDVEFPEAVRALALAGADLVAVPTALIRPFEIVARTLVPARAFENQVHLAYAGGCGTGYCGLSCIIGPDGRELARAADEPQLLTAELDVAAAGASRRLNPYLADLRPGLYRAPAD
jgi:5-aminopentanamidase